MATPSVVSLTLVVEDEDFLGFFDVMEVWRSKLGQSGPYEELTAEAYKRARIPKDSPDQPAIPVVGALVNISGLTLDVRVNEGRVDERDFTILFAGVDPLTSANAAAQITAQGLGRLNSYVATDGQLVVETTEAGTGASLKILSGDAAPTLGLPTVEPDSSAFGRDARIALVEGQHAYTFTDQLGSAEYFYRSRFRNSLSGAVSEFADAPQLPTVTPTSDHVVTGQLDLIDPSGQPMAGREVRLDSKFNGNIVDGKIVAGRYLIKRTDVDGHVEFTLLRGQAISVVVVGTDMIHDVEVPEDTSISLFNLFDPAYALQQDYFKIAVPDIPYMERRTL